MKLILCKKCSDLIKLDTEKRSCKCGACSGKYLDKIHAVFSGDDAVLLGFSNPSLIRAIMLSSKQEATAYDKEFTAFVITEPCHTIQRIPAEKI